jgi:3-dehydroquinate dehydratase-2
VRLKTQASEPYLSAMLHCTPTLSAGAGDLGAIARGGRERAPNQLLIERLLSNIYRSEIFGQVSSVSLAASGVICGFGTRGPLLALQAPAALLSHGR